MCCAWYLAPLCWLDNFNHNSGLRWEWICDLHDWAISR